MSSIGQIAFWKDGKFIWVNKSDLPPPSQRKRRAFYINTDTIDPVQSQLDGKMYDSKSALRATYKAAGYLEVGNEEIPIVQHEEPIENYENAFLRTVEEKGGWEVVDAAIKNIDMEQAYNECLAVKEMGFDTIEE